MNATLVRDALEDLLEGRDLDTERAAGVMDCLMEGDVPQAQVGALLAAFRAKGETVDELLGMVSSMQEHAVRVHLDVDAVDTCGTGGDGSNTFNISTAAAIVAAGAGCHVAKHGNRAATSRCGSADVLGALGVAVTIDAEGVRRCVEEAGIGFMFAPAFHPAMRHVASARGELGVRTVFNILGPLVNPALVRRQALGVGDPKRAEMMAAVLHRLGHTRALVYSGHGGVDELCLDGPARLFDVGPDGVKTATVDPRELGLASAPLSALCGGTAEDNAARIRAVLDGEPGPGRDVVLLNAAAAIVAADRAADLASGLLAAQAAVDSGAARSSLDALVGASQREASR